MASVAKQDPVDVAIGERLHQWMWRNRVSQVSFAELISVSQPSLGRKLRGDSAWSAGELRRTAAALGVSVSWLFGETEEVPVRPKGLEPLTFWSGVCRARRARHHCPRQRGGAAGTRSTIGLLAGASRRRPDRSSGRDGAGSVDDLALTA